MAYYSQAGEVTRGVPLRSPEPSATDGTPIRVVLGKKRFDAHDVGARYIMRKLVEAGMETIFIRFALVEELVEAAVQEDAHVIAMSVLTGGHLVIAGDLMAAAREAGLDDRLFIVGGVIADEDHPKLHELGINAVFGPGTKPEDIVTYVRANVSVDA